LFLSKLSTISGGASNQEVKENKLQPMLASESATDFLLRKMGDMAIQLDHVTMQLSFIIFRFWSSKFQLVDFNPLNFIIAQF
jgi:hypothetical protein